MLAASRPTSPAAACEDSISKSFAASPMLDPAPSSSRWMSCRRRQPRRHPGRRRSSRPPSSPRPRVHAVDAHVADGLGQEDVAGRVVVASRSKALRPVPTLISRKLRRPDAAGDQAGAGGQPDVHAGDVGGRPVPAEQTVAALGVHDLRGGERHMAPVEVMAPARRSPLRSVTVTKPLVVMSILPLQSAGVSTSGSSVKLIVVVAVGEILDRDLATGAHVGERVGAVDQRRGPTNGPTFVVARAARVAGSTPVDRSGTRRRCRSAPAAG